MMRTHIMLLMIVTLFAGCAMPTITVHEDALSAREHLKLGVSYEKKGELDLAEEHYEQARSLPESRLFLANLCFARKQWDKAEQQYKRAIEALPNDPRPLNNLAWLYYTRREQLGHAEMLARQAVEVAPKGEKAPYRNTLGSILIAQQIMRME